LYLITYLSGGMVYTVPNSLVLTYLLVQLRFLFGLYLISVLFSFPYTVGFMALSVLLADHRFFVDFGYLVSQHENTEDEE
jgi:hypothetical protein